MFPFLPHAYPIEVIQLLFALGGLAANTVTLWLAYEDVAFIRRNKLNGYKHFMARRNLLEEWARYFLNFIFMAIGVVSVFSDPPSPGTFVPETLTFQLAFTRVILMMGSVALTFKSVKDLTDRYKLQHMMHRPNDAESVLYEVKEKAEDIVKTIEGKDATK